MDEAIEILEKREEYLRLLIEQDQDKIDELKNTMVLFERSKADSQKELRAIEDAVRVLIEKGNEVVDIRVNLDPSFLEKGG